MIEIKILTQIFRPYLNIDNHLLKKLLSASLSGRQQQTMGIGQIRIIKKDILYTYRKTLDVSSCFW